MEAFPKCVGIEGGACGVRRVKLTGTLVQGERVYSVIF